MKRIIRRIKCRVGIHDVEGKLSNVMTESEKPITMGWHECRHCGYSKLKFVFSNWEGTSP